MVPSSSVLWYSLEIFLRNGALEFEAPALDVLGVAFIAHPGPFLEPKGESNRVSVSGNEVIPDSFPEVVRDVLADVFVHE